MPLQNAGRSIKTPDFLPPLPHILLELIDAILNDKKSSNDLAKIVQKDPALTGYLLRVANSALYGFSQKIVSIPQAVAVLGWRAVQNVALTASVLRTFQGVKSQTRFKEEFWWHSLACSFTMKQISDGFEGVNGDEAFVAGLLHDIGKLLLYKNYPEEYNQLLVSCKESDDLCFLEKDRFGSSHAELGAWLLESWRLQPFLVDAVRYHHDHSRISSALPLVKLTYLANIVSHSLFEEKDPNYLKNLERTCRDLDFSVLKIEQSMESIANSVSAFAESLGISVSSRPELLSGRLLSLGLQDLSARKEEELSCRIKDLASLLGLLRAFVKAGSIEDVMDITMEGLSVLFPTEAAIIMLLENDGKELVGKKAFGTKADGLANQVIINHERTGGIWKHIVDQRKIVHSASYFKDVPRSISDEQIQNLLGKDEFTLIPLSASTELVGVIVTNSLEELDDFLKVFASQAASHLKAQRMKESFSELKQLTSLILEKTPGGLMSLNNTGNVTYINPAMMRLLEIPEEQGKISRQVLCNYQSDLQEKIFGFFTGKDSEIARFLYKGPSGEERWLQGCRVSLNERESLVFLENVTEIVSGEEALRNNTAILKMQIKEKTKEVEEKQAEIIRTERIAATGRMASRIAHEINNPLGIIKNYLHIVSLRTEKDDANREPFRIIQEEIDRIAAIVKKLSGTGQITSDKMQKSDINQVLKDLTGMVRDYYLKQGIKFNLDLSPGPACANVASDKLKQVFLNVFKNAAESMAEGGEIYLSTGLDELKGFIEVEIQDTGSGIPPEMLDRIFDPHFSTKGFESCGLGLSVSREILSKMGGTIFVKGSSPQGTTFCIRIPLGNSIRQ